MITTPEQMREAAARLADIAAKTLAKKAPMMSRDTGVNQMFADLAATIRATPIAQQPTPIVDGSGPGPHYVADMLSQFVASVWHLLDNSETSGPIDDPITTVMQSDFDEVSKWLDRFEHLPSGSTSHLSAAELVATYLAPQPVAATVKPLVWGTFGKECLRAETVLGRYEVMWGFHNGQTSLDIPAPRRSHAWHSSVESAKAAAQADYDARIMSALTIQPADPLSDPRVVALVEAAKSFMHDVDDLIANSEGVSGLHMNGDVADWESLLPGGMFGAWLVSIDEFRAALRSIGGES